MGSPVEIFLCVAKKHIGIHITMNNQENDQKDACQGHHNFFSNGRGK
jgi:hypothetical protein